MPYFYTGLHFRHLQKYFAEYLKTYRFPKIPKIENSYGHTRLVKNTQRAVYIIFKLYF